MSETSNNHEAARRGMFQEAAEFGKSEGRGATARATYGLKMVEYAANGLADVSDAERFYTEYMGHSAAVQASWGGAKGKDGLKQNVSKWRQFLKMGSNKRIDAIAVAHNAAAIIKDERAKKTFEVSPFDALLNVCREQCKPGNVDEALTKEQIIECNMPKVRAERIEADELAKVKTQLEKHIEKYGEDVATTDAIEALDERIKELGGTSKQIKAAEKAAKKAEEEAAANS